MDLNDEIYKCLQILKDDQFVNRQSLSDLIELAGKQLRCERSDEEVSARIREFNHNQKRLFISIYSLYLETCRLNASLETESNELKSVLEHVDMLNEYRQLIIRSYSEINEKQENEFRSSVVERLKQLDGKQRFIDQFKAIELTMDSVVKSGRKTNYNHIVQTEYLMNIHTATTKHLFTCSIQNIEDLEKKFREIKKSVDKIFTVIKK